MNYRETVFNQGEIHFKTVKFRQSKDGRVDLKLNIPLTAMLDAQAKKSFMWGVATAISFTADCQQENVVITMDLLNSKFTEWGIAELTDAINSKKEASNG